MKSVILLTSLLLASTSAGYAFELSDVKTKDILGLTGPTKGEKLKPEVIASAKLEFEGIPELAGRSLRTRFWAIGGPSGVVPIHEHSHRPAVFTVASGEIYEYSTLAKEPILHKTGGLAMEFGELVHWWLNKGTEVVHLIAFDVQPVAKEPSEVEVSEVPAQANFKLPESKDVQHDLLGFVDLGEHFEGKYGTGWALSTYRTTIAPGGVFADFTAAGEPLQAFVWTGKVQEYRSDQSWPLPLKTRTGSGFAGGVTGYWKNTSDTPAEVYFGVVEPLTELEGLTPVGVLAHGEH